ncbi:MAG: helix-turn-helix domain-containing protein [Polyangiaceae bacterium]
MSAASDEQEFIRRFGQRVRSERLARKLSQEKLAEKVELSRGEISKIERARVTCSIGIAYRLASELRVGVSELMQGRPPTEGELMVRAALSLVEEAEHYRIAGLIAVAAPSTFGRHEAAALLRRPRPRKISARKK